MEAFTVIEEGTIVEDDRQHRYRVVPTDLTFQRAGILRVRPLLGKRGRLGDEQVIHKHLVKEVEDAR